MFRSPFIHISLVLAFLANCAGPIQIAQAGELVLRQGPTRDRLSSSACQPLQERSRHGRAHHPVSRRKGGRDLAPAEPDPSRALSMGTGIRDILKRTGSGICSEL